jgi:large subunit ribosomal protein L10
MTLRIEDKKEIVAEVNKAASSAHSIVVAQYHGLSVAQLTKLRVEARNNNTYVRIVRNSLAKRALQGTAFEILADAMVGPLIMGISQSEEDMGSAPRLFSDFAKDNKLEIVAAAFDGKLYKAQEVGVLANLPSREGALTLVASVMQAPVSKFGRLLTAYKEKLEAA